MESASVQPGSDVVAVGDSADTIHLSPAPCEAGSSASAKPSHQITNGSDVSTVSSHPRLAALARAQHAAPGLTQPAQACSDSLCDHKSCSTEPTAACILHSHIASDSPEQPNLPLSGYADIAVSMFSIDKTILASLIGRGSRGDNSRESLAKTSCTSADVTWQPPHGPVLFQGVDLNSLGRHCYSLEKPPLQSPPRQASIWFLPGLNFPLDLFQPQCGSVQRTLFTYLTVPAIAYHTVAVICILDLMFTDPERWWTDPVSRLATAGIGFEIVVALQTISMLVSAVAASAPANTDLFKVFLSMELPFLTAAVFIRRLAPLIDTVAAIALFIYSPFRWWLSGSHAGTAVLLGFLYALLVQLEVLAMYPVAGPAMTEQRRKSQRRMHALLLWLLHMNFVLGMCSTYKTYMTVTWLAAFQGACQLLYIGWWLAFISSNITDIADNFDWFLAFVFLKLPAFFASGMGFWCLGPHAEEWVSPDNCSAANWIVHGVAMVADILVLIFLMMLMFRLTTLGTTFHPLDGRPDSCNGTKANSATSGFNSFVLRERSLHHRDRNVSLASLRQRSKRLGAHATPDNFVSLLPQRQYPGILESEGLTSHISPSAHSKLHGCNASSRIDFLRDGAPGSTFPDITWNKLPKIQQKPASRRHSTVTFVDQVSSIGNAQQSSLENQLDVQKQGSK